MAATQQARVVYAGVFSQSLPPYNRRLADCSIIFNSSKHRSMSTIPDLLSLMYLRVLTNYRCKFTKCDPGDGKLTPP